MGGEHPVIFDGVSKRFRDFFLRTRVRALDGFSLRIASGESVGLIGPNGSGKTTAINLLVGLLRPSSGTVRLFGRDPRNARARVGLGSLSEENANYPFLTALEALMLHGRIAGLSRKEARLRGTELLARLGLEQAMHRQARTYSKGMGRRLGLAQALIAEPKLLILDEPTSGLDPVGTQDILSVLADCKRRGITILMSSHLLSEIEGMCDRIVMLAAGRIVKEGTTESFLRIDGQCDVRLRLGDEIAPEALHRTLRAQGLDVLDTKAATRSLADVYRDVFGTSNPEARK